MNTPPARWESWEPPSVSLVIGLGPSRLRSAPLAQALISAEVTHSADGNDGFQLALRLHRQRRDDVDLLAALAPMKRLALGIELDNRGEPLLDGVITHLHLQTATEPGVVTLSVTGRDLSCLMDLEERSQPYRNQSDSAIVSAVLDRYRQHGLSSAVTATRLTPSANQRIVHQHENDLQFLRRLAERNSLEFFVEPMPGGAALGSSLAYFGPERRGGAAQAVLSAGLGPASNVRSLSFALDSLAPVRVAGKKLDDTKVSDASEPRDERKELAANRLVAPRLVIHRDLARRSAGYVEQAQKARQAASPEPLTAEGELDIARYGGVLRARSTVAVRGAGDTFDGLYYVTRVNHTLERGKYSQRFSLSREGTGTTIKTVTKVRQR